MRSLAKAFTQKHESFSPVAARRYSGVLSFSGYGERLMRSISFGWSQVGRRGINMLKFQSILWALVAGWLLGGCDDIAKVSSGQIEVSPDELVFAKPAEGDTTARLSLKINNVGKALVRIASVELTGNDDSRELSIADADDWQSVKEIAFDSSATVTGMGTRCRRRYGDHHHPT